MPAQSIEHPCAPRSVMPLTNISYDEVSGNLQIWTEPPPEHLYTSLHLAHPWNGECGVQVFNTSSLQIDLRQLKPCVEKTGTVAVFNIKLAEYNKDVGCGSTTRPIKTFIKCAELNEERTFQLEAEVAFDRKDSSCPGCDSTTISAPHFLDLEVPWFFGELVTVTAHKTYVDSPGTSTLGEVKYLPVYTGDKIVALPGQNILHDGKLARGAHLLTPTSLQFPAIDLGYTNYRIRATIQVEDYGLRSARREKKVEIQTLETNVFELVEKKTSIYGMAFAHSTSSAIDVMQLKAALIQSASTMLRMKDLDVVDASAPRGFRRSTPLAVTVTVTSKHVTPIDATQLNASLTSFNLPLAQIFLVSASTVDSVASPPSSSDTQLVGGVDAAASSVWVQPSTIAVIVLAALLFCLVLKRLLSKPRPSRMMVPSVGDLMPPEHPVATLSLPTVGVEATSSYAPAACNLKGINERAEM